MRWFDKHDNIVALAEFLDSECSLFSEPADVLALLEKPWKWDREWELYQLWAQQMDPQRCERIIEAVLEETEPDAVLAEFEHGENNGPIETE